MLSKDSVQMAFPLAGKYAEEGKTIIAKPGSLLSELVALSFDQNIFTIDPESMSVEEGMTQTEGYARLIAQMVEMHTESSVDRQTAHSLCKDSVSKDISKPVAAHISFAKNEVVPVVEEVTKSILNYVQTTAPLKAEQSINLIEYGLPDILRDEEFLQNISYMEGKAILDPEKTLDLNVKTGDELFQLLLTNQKSTDEMILPWASMLDKNFLSSLYTSFFTKVSSTGSKGTIAAGHLFVLPITQRIDAALALYLIATNLQSKVEKTNDGISLAKYNMYLEQMKDFAAGLLWQLVNRFSVFSKVRTLVLEVAKDNKSITVYTPVYDEFLKAGGTPETVLGLVSSKRILTTSDAILAQKADLEGSWNQYVLYFNSAELNKRIEYFRDFIIVKTNDIVNGEKIKAIDEYRAQDSSYNEKLKTKLLDYISMLTLGDLEHPQTIGLTIGAKIIFYFTDAYKILHGIEEASLVNPNIDVREAAMLSTLAYVSDYVASQLVVA